MFEYWQKRPTNISRVKSYTNINFSMADSTKVLCPENLFLNKNLKDTKIICPIIWTYDICAAGTGTYYDYYCQQLG